MMLTEKPRGPHEPHFILSLHAYNVSLVSIRLAICSAHPSGSLILGGQKEARSGWLCLDLHGHELDSPEKSLA